MPTAWATTVVNEPGESPNILGIGVNLNLHVEFSFGLEFSITGNATTVINLLENTMKNLNTAANHCFNTFCNITANTFGLLKCCFGECLEQVSSWSIWCGVLLLRSQVGNTPTRIGKRQVVRGRLYQEKLGRFESFPPHQLIYAWLTVRWARPMRKAAQSHQP